MTQSIIAVVGASASGKSLFAQTIYRELSQELAVEHELAIIEEDSYYRDQSHLPLKHRSNTNYDHPNALDHDLLLQHLTQLRNGEAVEVPVYDYAVHNRVGVTRHVKPAKVVIIDGILLLTNEKLREQFDIKLFMDTPLDVCLLRRIKRDMEERNRSLKSISEQYIATVRPMFYEFIEPCKKYADIVVTRGGKNRIAIDMLKHRIQSILS